MDQAAAARHRLEAVETRAHPLCRAATLRRRPGPGGENRRKPAWPLAAQQQSCARHCPTKRLLPLARSCFSRGAKGRLIYRTAVYGTRTYGGVGGGGREADPYPDCKPGFALPVPTSV